MNDPMNVASGSDSAHRLKASGSITFGALLLAGSVVARAGGASPAPIFEAALGAGLILFGALALLGHVALLKLVQWGALVGLIYGAGHILLDNAHRGITIAALSFAVVILPGARRPSPARSPQRLEDRSRLRG